MRFKKSPLGAKKKVHILGVSHPPKKMILATGLTGRSTPNHSTNSVGKLGNGEHFFRGLEVQKNINFIMPLKSRNTKKMFKFYPETHFY